ncbi:solute carrier family 2, facilitated glucose transporter member 1 isoform X1 [Tetranychus urticae]|uniref:solute carrier family 2, facilitated glucose transporter member 1 isoform X1 n=1 Tax=Tetranychus urticae TaxID=32264 RepID=UPI00077BAE66|nr:solute carrier family 2, facilitated glucose transporter member 1 isoform X1 [Tetranychus urticae]
MDDLRLSETAYLNVPERDKSPSPADSVASSISDISTLPITGRRKEHGGVTSRLLFAIAAGAIGSSFQHGYNTGVTNIPQKQIEAWINETYARRFAENPDQQTISLIFSLLASIYCVGGMVGALSTAYFATKFGRKGGLLVNNVFLVIGIILNVLAKPVGFYELLVIGRFFVGINSGMAAGLTPMYLTEISPTNLRGAVGTMYQLILVISILISNVLGFENFLGSPTLWPYLFAIPLIPMIFMFATLPLCPESPKHLLIVQGREGLAASGLSWLRGSLEIHDELEEIRQEAASMSLVPKVSFMDMWRNPIYRQPMFISVVVMLSQQFSGINAVIFYSTQIFRDAGLEGMKAIYATLGMSVINTAMTIVSLILVERAGRKTLHLGGLIGMLFTTIILCVSINNKGSSFWEFVSVIMVLTFVIMFATGPGSIPWFLVGELFGSSARGMATSIAVCVNWAANFIVTVGFLPLSNLMGAYVFLIFTVLLAIFSVYTYFKVPETKGKSAEEIAALFRQKSYQ